MSDRRFTVHGDFPKLKIVEMIHNPTLRKRTMSGLVCKVDLIATSITINATPEPKNAPVTPQEASSKFPRRACKDEALIRIQNLKYDYDFVRPTPAKSVSRRITSMPMSLPPRRSVQQTPSGPNKDILASPSNCIILTLY
ncbi:unnamed protein product [Protopolystoma xenopodis]|uniref:Uncharacterized protein n=1 Tax=Protopolystoma xenopodis TaxID=117903 RepID=A0A3S5ART6_9PLAT|nr:unnamed protein product [Protopolystoma xenopodis]